ncbi:hypothetical protein [Oceanobacillus iheyensis HTE831]|uniref:Uncharacterized protein n=1 Tax=Oceanobacillus iheyensis (strain DSM 14371 / CIP 107618 / JCM 11309 / KCTC 3954 / HTE831) TaxID=221109 RepID=Q8EL74_OCEIH|nr:hypothetical protein [Oceanobacillus iheyensis]BAC15313.1 hypothetical protein [Oceanobacillus iheyensis HTE831]
MKRQQQTIKQQLDNELEQLTFTKQAVIIHHVQKQTWKQKCAAIWNKEIEVPLIPVTSVSLVVLLSVGIAFSGDSDSTPENTHSYETIKVGGNVYIKEDFEELVMQYED